MTSIDHNQEISSSIEHQQKMVTSFRQIFEANPDGVLCVDQERRVIVVNPAAELLFGYQEAELLGRRTDCLYSNEEDFLRVSSERFRSNGELLRKPIETILRKKDGTTFPAEIVQTIKGFVEKLILDGGCVKADLYQDLDDKNILYFMAEWQTREDLEKFKASKSLAALLGLETLLAESVEIKHAVKLE